MRADVSASSLCVAPVCDLTLPMCVLYPMLSLVRMMSSASCKSSWWGWWLKQRGSMASLTLYLPISLSHTHLLPLLSLSLSIYLSTYLSIYIFIYISRSSYLDVLYLFISSFCIIFPLLTLYISLFLARYLPYYLSIYELIYLSLSLSLAAVSIYLSIYLTLFISIYLTIFYLSISLFG